MGDTKSNRCALESLLLSAEGRKEFTYIIMHIANKELEKLLGGLGFLLSTEISKKALKQYMDCCHHHH